MEGQPSHTCYFTDEADLDLTTSLPVAEILCKISVMSIGLSGAASPFSEHLPATTSGTTTSSKQQPPQGLRKNGKQWHPPRAAFRPTSGQTTYTARMALLRHQQATKAVEKELKAEKAAERDRRVQAIKERRANKEEKERYEKMAEKMHRKVVERRRRREKRNRLLGGGK